MQTTHVPASWNHATAMPSYKKVVSRLLLSALQVHTTKRAGTAMVPGTKLTDDKEDCKRQ